MRAALRVRAARDLALPTARSLRWELVPLAAVMVAGLLWWKHGALDDPVRRVWVLRAVAAVLATAVVGAVVEPARALLAPLPVPLWWRAVLRLLVVLVPAAAVWCAALGWVVGGSGADVPVGALSVEAAAVLAVGLALTGGLARWRDLDDPGVVAGPAVLCLSLLAWQLPPRVALLVLPGPQWTAAHARWAALLGAALVVVVLSVRDPARPSPGAPWPARRSSCVRG